VVGSWFDGRDIGVEAAVGRAGPKNGFVQPSRWMLEADCPGRLLKTWSFRDHASRNRALI